MKARTFDRFRRYLALAAVLGLAAGAAQAQPLQKIDTARPVPSEIIIAEDNLKGVKAMSVEVVVGGISDIPESSYRSEIESRLKAAGISVLPPTKNPRTYPVLKLVVRATFIRAQNNTLLGSFADCQLRFEQLIPTTVSSRTMYVMGITWMNSDWTWGPSIGIVSKLRESYRGLTDTFVKDYKTVNAR